MMKLKLLPYLLITTLLANGCQKTDNSVKTTDAPREKNVSWTPGEAIVDGTYRVYTDNGLTLSTDLSLNDQSNPRLYDYTPTKGQRWKITKVDAEYYNIVNVNSNKALHVPFSLANLGLRLWQYTLNTTNAQKFKITYQNGHYIIVNKNGRAVTIEGAKANEAYIAQDANTDAAGQQWQFQQVAENPTEVNKYFYNALRSSGADPYVIQKDGDYFYLNTTGGNISMLRTKKISALSDGAFKVVWTPPAGTMYSQNLWAPEMYYYPVTQKWYIYFTADNGIDANHRMHVLENANPDPTTTSWEYKGQITDDTNLWAIDGTILPYGNKFYFIWSGWRTASTSNSGIQQLYIARMLTPWTLEGTRVMISEPTYNWERNGLVNEGPEVLRNPANDVFLIYSGSGCWTDDYKLGMLRLKKNGNPLNPADWTKAPEPVFQKSVANSVYAPGHNSFFKSADYRQQWHIYHANSAPGQGCGGYRSPRIQQITWNTDGTPNFGIPLKTGVALIKPSGE